MEWYWYLVIALAIFLIFVLIALFGSKALKKLAYELVLNAEKLLGDGQGDGKLNLVLTKLSEMTKGAIPVSILKSIVEWAVKKMKNMLLEDEKSQKKHMSKDESDS